jgi:hypothetical protein
MMFWNTNRQTDSTDPTYGIVNHERLEPADLDAEELSRAHGALAYLKAKIGNDGMCKLLADDLGETTRRTGAWAAESQGWKSANLKLVVPGPGAAAFHGFFMEMMKQDRQLDLRAGHPDHFMNVPMGLKAEVIENVGEDNLPWFIELKFTNDEEQFPGEWDSAYPERLGALIFNTDGIQIGSAMHELRDTPEGTEISLTITLPEAAPDGLLDGHLRHFAVEFCNWTRMAREQR